MRKTILSNISILLSTPLYPKTKFLDTQDITNQAQLVRNLRYCPDTHQYPRKLELTQTDVVAADFVPDDFEHFVVAHSHPLAAAAAGLMPEDVSDD